MLKKFLIIGLVFLLAGVSALQWQDSQESKWQILRQRCMAKYAAGSDGFLQDWLKLPQDKRGGLVEETETNTSKTDEEIRQEQYERFVADLDKLDTIETHLYPVARILYGNNWREELRQYKRKQEQQKIFFAGAVIFCCVGGVLTLSSLSGIVIVRLHKTRPHHSTSKPLDDTNSPKETENSEQTSEQNENKQPQKNTLASILNCHEYTNEVAEEVSQTSNGQAEQAPADDKTAKVNRMTQHLYTDSESAEIEGPKQKSHLKLSELLAKGKNTDTADTGGSFFSSYKGIKQVKGEIDRGAKKFKKDAKLARHIGEHKPDLLDETLSRLTEEVAAIRHYAGKQEESVKKFQQGYDWNIIRNFALRVIRCIDNLERRITALSENGQPAEHLEEVRDELLFAMESTGLERYEPQLNSDYRGQEKTAEAVKDRTSADEEELKGKVADIVRCGYRYVVDSENFKVVRAAQVKLFG